MSRKRNDVKEVNVGKIIENIIFWSVMAGIFFCIFFFKFKYIETGSMKPTLQIGSIVMVNPHNEAKIGDIAMYKESNYYVVHRIIDTNEKGEYIFQGDNVGSPDTRPIKKEQIIGPVSYHFNFIAPVIRKIYHLDYLQ